MASITCSGISTELAKFDRMGKNLDRACRKAAKAGGEVLAERLAEAAPVYDGLDGHHKNVTPGALRDSIKAGKVKYNPADGYHCEVKPEGNDHGQSLARIGNILEHGRSNMRPQPWFHTTVEDYAGDVINAMRKAYEETQKG